jgi:hypothetical protein
MLWTALRVRRSATRRKRSVAHTQNLFFRVFFIDLMLISLWRVQGAVVKGIMRKTGGIGLKVE